MLFTLLIDKSHPGEKALKDSKREAIYNDVLTNFNGMWGSKELHYQR
jgi:hypothetical protein